MKTIREINRYDYELYDLLENYFIRKNYPKEIKSLLEKLLTTMKKIIFTIQINLIKGIKMTLFMKKNLKKLHLMMVLVIRDK